MRFRKSSTLLVMLILSSCGGPEDQSSASLDQKLEDLKQQGWNEVSPGVVERRTTEGGILQLGYTQQGLGVMRQKAATDLAVLERRFATSPDPNLAQQIQGLRSVASAAALPDDRDLAATPLATVTSSCTAFLNVNGQEFCGCSGTTPRFELKAFASWSGCFDMNGQAKTCIDGTCQDLTRSNKLAGDLAATLADTSTAGTTLYGSRYSHVWGVDPATGTSVDQSQNYPMLSCTLPSCAPPPGECGWGCSSGQRCCIDPCTGGGICRKFCPTPICEPPTRDRL